MLLFLFDLFASPTRWHNGGNDYLMGLHKRLKTKLKLTCVCCIIIEGQARRKHGVPSEVIDQM
jgi:hypothetical protein